MGKFVWVPDSEEEKARPKEVGVKVGNRFLCTPCFLVSEREHPEEVKKVSFWCLPPRNEVGLGGKADPVRCASCGDWYCLEEVVKEVPEFPGSGPVASGSVLTSTKELYEMVQDVKGCNPAKDDPILLKVKGGKITKVAVCEEDLSEATCYEPGTRKLVGWED
jgi:hypothetical protein